MGHAGFISSNRTSAPPSSGVHEPANGITGRPVLSSDIRVRFTVVGVGLGLRASGLGFKVQGLSMALEKNDMARTHSKKRSQP